MRFFPNTRRDLQTSAADLLANWRPPTERSTLPAMRRWLLLSTLMACSSPAAGGWRGTADVGPVAAYEIAIRFNDDASQGQVSVREPGRPFSQQWFQLCSLEVDRRVLVATYDPSSPECQGAMSGRRELRGMIGEQVIWGEIWQQERKSGFFRAFREPPAPAGGPIEATATVAATP